MQPRNLSFSSLHCALHPDSPPHFSHTHTHTHTRTHTFTYTCKAHPDSIRLNSLSPPTPPSLTALQPGLPLNSQTPSSTLKHHSQPSTFFPNPQPHVSALRPSPNLPAPTKATVQGNQDAAPPREEGRKGGGRGREGGTHIAAGSCQCSCFASTTVSRSLRPERPWRPAGMEGRRWCAGQQALRLGGRTSRPST